MSEEEGFSTVVMEEAMALMRHGKREAACTLLLEARDEALSKNALFAASIYSSIRGSYLVAMGKDEEAYKAYLDAEKESGGSPQHRISLARHLIHSMRRPQEALLKVEEVIAGQPSSLATIQEALAVRGLAQLALGQTEEAANRLREILVGYQCANLPSFALDLTLVEELLRHRQDLQICRAYLDFVEARALEEAHQSVLGRVRNAKAMLQGGPA